MSRTDHPRKPRIHGHRTTVRHVRLYGGRTADQSQCSCGEVGMPRASWHEANSDGVEHARRAYAQTSAVSA